MSGTSTSDGFSLNITYPNLSAGLSFCTAIVVAIQLCCLVFYILVMELLQAQRALTLRNFFTPANTLLFASLVSLLAMTLLNGFYSLGTTPLLEALIQFCLGTIELCYTFFSAERSQLIVTTLFPSRLKLFKCTIALAPAIYYAQVIPPILHMFLDSDDAANLYKGANKWHLLCYTFNALAGIFLILVDTALLAAFLHFIFKARKGGFRADPQLDKVAWYGVYASAACYVTFLVFGAAFLGRGGSWRDSSEESVGLRRVVMTVAICMIDIVLMTLFGMKVAVNRLERYGVKMNTAAAAQNEFVGATATTADTTAITAHNFQVDAGDSGRRTHRTFEGSGNARSANLPP
ncbi:hypothetical protein CcCBS67573_g09917 [Chytriomyces confervae]|uniref:G-protein coupled receptors family 1 profile domain-containing protein n=1 Tax=Chytriomyces confervae TaxID=246404 RepID=A0A507DLT6_9FUNG|nr:hypothetical protein CcCBS67573_g09917 [Chytriomyces confervae]